MKVLVTGSAGFIGNFVSLALLDRGDEIIGLDNLNDYYDVNLKKSRLARISSHPKFTEAPINLEDRGAVEKLFDEHKPERVIHLAAQAGVRYSLENPHAFVDSNVVGFLNILEGCRHNKIAHLVYASSSSVYGSNTRMPFSVQDPVDHPISLYAATKRANELMAHTYSHLHDIPTTGLRFFTVYGPWGRPDMALFLFTKAIIEGKPIDVFNKGDMKRAFTYIDDIVEGVVKSLDKIPVTDDTYDFDNPDPATSGGGPFRVSNIGNDQCVPLMRYIEVLEDSLGIKAKMNLLPMQPGDVPATWADIADLKGSIGYQPSTPIETGIVQFVEWYREYYGVAK